ncbi:GNAT family N-acetyltransferase [Enterococcus pallens]|uniref:N-acetyltransferase domain-containing protein n=1 Tax=Enterococcus pallens ATCC BAA-351 TaxID=1158607 RepID=R2QFB8_9ENTE|nr:GNAT family N-acetyltransferase [Enterococcus pallens]EOH95202.1 hypothetical protein UAU_01617 [Enterococcus pallens ATCC BAA-351]EOU14986.1 hypothetical protein I588_04636 [Enterococcus pallens ATCC BAA-351]OJG78245.1 hypothetical protein RV10_GL001733 [Enterococcus pallens]
MTDYQIIKFSEVTNLQKEQAVDVFLEGFGHMMTFTKENEKLEALFLDSFNPSYILLYKEAEQILGIVGIATNKVRPIKFNKSECQKLFGNVKGSIICGQMNAIFQSKAVEEETDLYIDVLATAKAARGKGVASKLIQYCLELPDFQTCHLEVLSKNANAKRLYEHLGFAAYKHQRLSPTLLQGWGTPSK